MEWGDKEQSGAIQKDSSGLKWLNYILFYCDVNII